MDILRLVNDNELLTLKYLYANYFPKSFSAYMYILNQIEWNKKLIEFSNEPNVSDRFFTKFYTLKTGDFNKNGTFISISGEKEYFVTLFTLERDLTELKKCLFDSDIIKYELAPTFHNIIPEHVPLIYKLVENKKFDIELHNKCLCYWMPKIFAMNLQYEIPEEVVLRQLTSDDVNVINNVWPHKYPDSDIFLNNLIKFNYGFGLYTKNNGKLISWIIKNEFSGIGLLQTIDSETGKGYGKLLTKILSKKIALEHNENVICHSLRINEKAQKLFLGLGYIIVGDLNWIFIKRK